MPSVHFNIQNSQGNEAKTKNCQRNDTEQNKRIEWRRMLVSSEKILLATHWKQEGIAKKSFANVYVVLTAHSSALQTDTVKEKKEINILLFLSNKIWTFEWSYSTFLEYSWGLSSRLVFLIWAKFITISPAQVQPTEGTEPNTIDKMPPNATAFWFHAYHS